MLERPREAMMNIEDRNDLDLNIAFARTVLSLLVLVSWYVDPSYGDGSTSTKLR